MFRAYALRVKPGDCGKCGSQSGKKMANYQLIPGGGVSVPFPAIGEAAGDYAGTALGAVLAALQEGAAGSGPIGAALDFLEAHGGPFAAGFVRGLRRSQGRPPSTQPEGWYSPCNHLWQGSFKYQNDAAPGDPPNSVRTWNIRSAGSVTVEVNESGYIGHGFNCDGSPFDAFQAHGPFNRWEPSFGQPTLTFLALEGNCAGGPCTPPDSDNPIAPYVPNPIIPVPPPFVPPSLPIPSPSGGPIVVVPVVPVIPVFIDADLNVDANFNVDIIPTINVGPFNIQIGPSHVDVNIGLPGRDAPRLPPGTPRPDPGDDGYDTRPPQPLPPDKGGESCIEWGESRIQLALRLLEQAEKCACREKGEFWSYTSALESSISLTLPRGRDVIARIAVTEKPANAKQQWGGGTAPDVFYCGWYSISPNGAGDRNPVHYLEQELYLGDIPIPTVMTVTLYIGFKGILTVSGYNYPEE